MTARGTTNDSERQRVVQRVTSGTTSDKEWQQMTTSDNEWQRVTANGNEWYNEWKQIRVILGFRMKQLCNAKLQYIQQRFFENIM